MKIHKPKFDEIEKAQEEWEKGYSKLISETESQDFRDGLIGTAIIWGFCALVMGALYWLGLFWEGS